MKPIEMHQTRCPISGEGNDTSGSAAERGISQPIKAFPGKSGRRSARASSHTTWKAPISTIGSEQARGPRAQFQKFAKMRTHGLSRRCCVPC